MATHKVPQDVEADDKLIGFLSLKQFIFVILGLGFGYLTFFFFAKVHPITSLIWVPPTAICLILGLYQRKDQPVEVYLASALRFYLKPRKRKWSQEGYEERVIITAPPKVEHNYTKNFTGQEALSRLNSLSHLMDTRGWASKQIGDWQNPQLATAAAADRIVAPAQLLPSGINVQQYTQPVDVMDEQNSLAAAAMSAQISATEEANRQRAIQAATQPDNVNSPTLPMPRVQAYPTSMQQKVINPVSQNASTRNVSHKTRTQSQNNLSRASASAISNKKGVTADAVVHESIHNPKPKQNNDSYTYSVHHGDDVEISLR